MSSSREKTTIVCPCPVLAELLSKPGSRDQEILDELKQTRVMEIAPFDQRAAIEWALQIRSARKPGDKKGGAKSPWEKYKFDRQIVAIAAVEGAVTIYSADPHLRGICEGSRIQVVHPDEIPLPEDAKQTSLLDLIPSDEQ